MTSSDVVGDIRYIFDMRRVGHTGTLDPGAAGVLPVCLGRATRLFDYLVDKRKEYIAELASGAETDTEDAYGTVVGRSDTVITDDMLRAVLPGFLGEQQQTAPMYSSVRVDGKQMYKLARSGVEITEGERRVREITVYALELIREIAPGRFLLRIECGKGTYVRTLVKDISRAAGGMGYMSFLLRSKSGSFTLDNAFTLEELRGMKEAGTLMSAVIPVERALSHLQEARLTLNSRDTRRLVNGAAIDADVERDAPLRVYIDGEFIGIGRADADGLSICTYFREDTGD